MPLDTNRPNEFGVETYHYNINGSRYSTTDPMQPSRELLQQVGFVPASDYSLIQLHRPGTTSIGLDEVVNLVGQPKAFRAFRTDRTYLFTVDERGYEWGAPTVTEEELRDVTATPEDKRFVLTRENEPDKFIEPETSVDLAGRGTERLYTATRQWEIFVNARPIIVASDHLTYWELVRMAFDPIPSGPEICFTVAYRKGPLVKPKGTVAPGESVNIKTGEIFVVTQTNRS